MIQEKSLTKAQKTRNKILKEAALLFSSKGYFGVSVDDIAKKAGIKKSTLYYHFSSKEELLNIVVTESYQKLKQELAKAVDYSTLPSDYIFNIVLTLLNFRIKHPEITLLNSLALKSDNKITALAFVEDVRKDLIIYIRDLLSSANFIRKITYKSMGFLVVHIISFALNPFVEIGSTNKQKAKDFSELISI